MSELRPDVIHSVMRALVARLGCLDAVAATINAGCPGTNCNKSLISRRMSGELAWPLEHILVLEDALGVWPISELMVERLAARQAGRGTLPLSVAAGAAAKENGEAISAILRADSSGRFGDLAEAERETREAIDALEVALAALDQARREGAPVTFKGRGR